MGVGSKDFGGTPFTVDQHVWFACGLFSAAFIVTRMPSYFILHGPALSHTDRLGV